MNIFLFGPPGIGKSTLVGALKSAGYRAVDLEDIYPAKIRFQLPNMVDNVVFGGADLNPARKYQNGIRVILQMQQQQYEHRRARRDALNESKGAQAKHQQWSVPASDDVIYLDVGGSVEETVKKLESIIQSYITSEGGKSDASG